MKINTISSFNCSFCSSSNMELIMDFGTVALAGAFLKTKEFDNEQKYPMRLCFCKNCYAVQVVDKIEPDILFKDYFYFSSHIKTLSNHFVDYAKELTNRFLNSHEATVLEFGCNDGILLRPLADQGISKVIGVDPAKNIVSSINDERVTIINDYFSDKISREVVAKYGFIDLIMANNVFAHISDINNATNAVKNALSDEGVFVFEVHYLDKIVQELQYDMIYHEHLYYYSLLSAIEHFKKYDLKIFDIKQVPIHAGSIRFYVAKKNSNRAKTVSENVKLLLHEEKIKAYDKIESFKLFSKRVENTKDQLIKLLKELKKKGKTVAGYGASGRANTMIQYCEITNELVKYMIDDAPAKVGCYTPGSHLEIVASSVLYSDNPPDYVLVFAWSFFEEISKRNKKFIESGGKMIIPLPEVKIISF
ncbi:class I SAM-dependent methyltransferase [Pelagibacteraceae bacterium]|nr:class I SAM-dependent methyltransferase [Pelagibacteraceae bacterium]